MCYKGCFVINDSCVTVLNMGLFIWDYYVIVSCSYWTCTCPSMKLVEDFGLLSTIQPYFLLYLCKPLHLEYLAWRNYQLHPAWFCRFQCSHFYSMIIVGSAFCLFFMLILLRYFISWHNYCFLTFDLNSFLEFQVVNW